MQTVMHHRHEFIRNLIGVLRVNTDPIQMCELVMMTFLVSDRPSQHISEVS